MLKKEGLLGGLHGDLCWALSPPCGIAGQWLCRDTGYALTVWSDTWWLGWRRKSVGEPTVGKGQVLSWNVPYAVRPEAWPEGKEGLLASRLLRYPNESWGEQ